MSRTETLEKEIRKYTAEYISREASRQSMITVTRSELSSDGKRMVLYISVLPNRAEPIAMDFLKRHQDDIREYVKTHSKVQRVPWLRFSLDKVTSIDFDLQDLHRSDVRYVKIGANLLLEQLL